MECTGCGKHYQLMANHEMATSTVFRDHAQRLGAPTARTRKRSRNATYAAELIYIHITASHLPGIYGPAIHLGGTEPLPATPSAHAVECGMVHANFIGGQLAASTAIKLRCKSL